MDFPTVDAAALKFSGLTCQEVYDQMDVSNLRRVTTQEIDPNTPHILGSRGGHFVITEQHFLTRETPRADWSLELSRRHRSLVANVLVEAVGSDTPELTHVELHTLGGNVIFRGHPLALQEVTTRCSLPLTAMRYMIVHLVVKARADDGVRQPLYRATFDTVHLDDAETEYIINYPDKLEVDLQPGNPLRVHCGVCSLSRDLDNVAPDPRGG